MPFKMHKIILYSRKNENRIVPTLPKSLNHPTETNLFFLICLIKGKKGGKLFFNCFKSKLSVNVLILLINVTFMSRINSMLCSEHEYSFVIPRPGPEVIKLFSSPTQLCMKFQLLIKTKVLKNADCSQMFDFSCL